jgi:diguanylate cyclase (GGDEF)-like protein
VNGKDDADILVKKVLAVFDQPFQLKDHELRITASIGVSLYPRDGQDADTLLKHADIAVYQAKQYGNTFKFYENSVSSND